MQMWRPDAEIFETRTAMAWISMGPQSCLQMWMWSPPLAIHIEKVQLRLLLFKSGPVVGPSLRPLRVELGESAGFNTA